MAAVSRGLTAAASFGVIRGEAPAFVCSGSPDKNRNGFLELQGKRRSFIMGDSRNVAIKCCCLGSVVPIPGKGAAKKCTKKYSNNPCYHPKIGSSSPALRFASAPSQYVSKQEKLFVRCTPGNSGPQSHDSPPKRDTGIANEKDWGINLVHDNENESGINEDGSSWYRESGEDLGENGYRCRWTRMGGRNHDGSSEWKETV